MHLRVKLGGALKLIITVETTGRHQGVGLQTGRGFPHKNLSLYSKRLQIDTNGGLNNYNSVKL